MTAYQSSRHEELAQRLEEVRERQGVLTPRAVLTDVKALGRRHPLYEQFEWNNRVAGEAHRLDQAHRLIMKVRVTYVDDHHEEHKVRAYAAVPQPTAYQPNYEPIEEVALDALKRKLVLQQAERQWRALRRQYAGMAEFMDMVLRDLHDDTG